MNIRGIEVRGMSFEEMQKFSPKVTSTLLNLLTEGNMFGLELDEHFFIEFVAGKVNVDHNHRAIRIVLRVGDIFNTVDVDKAVEGGMVMEQRVKESMRKLLEDNNVFATVLVEASM